jgi:hypothetical protein
MNDTEVDRLLAEWEQKSETTGGVSP